MSVELFEESGASTVKFTSSSGVVKMPTVAGGMLSPQQALLAYGPSSTPGKGSHRCGKGAAPPLCMHTTSAVVLVNCEVRRGITNLCVTEFGRRELA